MKNPRHLRRWTKQLILLSAVSAISGLPRNSWADDEGGGSLFQASELSRLPIAPQDFSQLNPHADHLAKPGLFGMTTSLTDAIWVGLGGNTSWLNPTNWSTAQIPDDSAAAARFLGLSGGPIVQLNNATITLRQLEMSDPLYTSIVGGTIIMAGANSIQPVIFADGTNFDLPEKVFTSFGTTDLTNPRPGNNIGGPGTLAATFAGTMGFNKTGDTHLQIDSPQFFTGSVSITGGGKIITTIGDSAFGGGSNTIALNSGSIQVSINNWATSRTIDVGGSGGSIYWVDTARSVDFSGNFTGSTHFDTDGTTVLLNNLILNGNYGANVGSMLIHSSNAFSGQLTIGGGTVALRDNGAFVNTPFIRNSGTLVLDDSVSHVADRIGDNATIMMRGGALTVTGASTNYDETVGSLALDGGLSVITVNAGSGGAKIHFGDVTRGVGVGSLNVNNASGLYIRGPNLGNAPGANTANVYLNNGTSLLVNGILPFAWGNANAATYSIAESPDNTLLTYGANGVAPIATPASTFTGSTSATNVRISGYGSSQFSPTAVVNGHVNVNSLILAAPADLVAPNIVNTGGMTVVPDSTNGGTLHITSGVILSANAGLTNSSGTPTNSLPGNVLYADIDFGSTPGVIMTPSAITIYGNIHGTAGLTKIGGRTAWFRGTSSDYTGQTILSGFNRFENSVPSGANSVFGADTSPIVLYGGNAAASGTGLGQLGSSSGGSISFDRPLDIRGDTVLLRAFGGGTLVWNGAIDVSDPNTTLKFLRSASNGHMVVNGSISGPGKVIVGSSDTSVDAQTWVDLMNSASFQGGLVLAGGTIGIGHDKALGSHIETTSQADGNGGTIIISTEVFNTVQVSGNTLMTGIGGPRSLANNFVVYGSTIGFGGSQPITLTGTVSGRGGDYLANINASTTINFSGSLTGGGMAMIRTQAGSGTLVLSGNNTFTGVLAVGNGQTGNGMMIIESNTATGSTISPTIVDYGNGAQNTLALLDPAGTVGLNIGLETLDIRGSGVNSFGALYNIVGNNTWSGVVRPSPTYDNPSTASVSAPVAKQYGAIGVAASTTLTLASGVIGNDPGALNGSGTPVFLANSIGVRKVGAGTLVIGSHNVDTQIQVGTTTVDNYWNAAIDVTGSLDIQNGLVRIKRNSGIATISGGKSVVDVASVNFAGTIATPTTTLDLTSNGMIIDYSTTSPLANIRAFLKAGYHGGLWDGNGITSSMAATSPNSGEGGKTALGYGEATALGNITTFMGDPIRPTASVYDAVVIKYTYAGDANLDGKVDITDLISLAQHWNLVSNQVWTSGDFTYDGVVNVADLFALAKNWQVGVGNPLTAPALGPLLSSLGLPNAPDSIPEPATVSLAVVGFVGLLQRRRRSFQRHKRL